MHIYVKVLKGSECEIAVSIDPMVYTNPGRFGPIPIRSGRFVPGRFSPISRVGHFGPILGCFVSA